MDKEALINFLKENLVIKANDSFRESYYGRLNTCIEVQLFLGDEMISEDFVLMKDLGVE